MQALRELVESAGDVSNATVASLVAYGVGCGVGWSRTGGRG